MLSGSNSLISMNSRARILQTGMGAMLLATLKGAALDLAMDAPSGDVEQSGDGSAGTVDTVWVSCAGMEELRPRLKRG